MQMSENKAYETIDEYIAQQPEQTRAALISLREYILEVAPDAEQLINYDIAAFALVKGGKRDKQIMMAGYAKHVGFYPAPQTIEHFAGELAEYKYAKGSVQFPLNKPLPKDLIIRMVRWRKKTIAQDSKNKVF